MRPEGAVQVDKQPGRVRLPSRLQRFESIASPNFAMIDKLFDVSETSIGTGIFS